MEDIICSDHHMLQVINSFGFTLGFGDQTVQEACFSQKIDLTTFLSVINFIHHPQNEKKPENSFPQNISPCTLTNYVQRSHDYFLHYRLPVTELRAIVESAANLEVAGMEKGLSTLATCAGMAPMIGFLGTVVGMVQAFYDMAMAGNNINITLLSRGIYTAMITTVAGLIVGIIAYFAYNALTAKIDHIVTKMETASADFMEVIYEVKNEKENK